MSRQTQGLIEVLGLVSLGLGLYATWCTIESTKKAKADRERMLTELALIRRLVSK